VTGCARVHTPSGLGWIRKALPHSLSALLKIGQQILLSRRYTIVVADRETGGVRRFTFRVRPLVLGAAITFVTPIMLSFGLGLSASMEAEHLRASKASLEQENTSYREATGALTTQIESLQSSINDLGIRARVDPVSARAMDKLPAQIKNQGGTSLEGASALLTPEVAVTSSPERAFGLLQGVLSSLEGHLRIVRRNVERREALLNATPSIWPIHGWLSAGYGRRPDPFTGEVDFHPGLDISAETGTPVQATAAGTVELAAPNGDYGNLVVINHGFGLATRYGHLSKFAVWQGKHVERGEIIGYVGATGRATGPHLHYEVLANGRLMNPLQLLAGKSLP
jgi:murein DD-endopeptidase MepM/ murein hydrolase activator NlpD